MEKQKFVAARRFNRYRIGQAVTEVGAKLQKLIRTGLVHEVKIVEPEEVKAEPPAAESEADAPKPKRKRKPKATPEPAE